MDKKELVKALVAEYIETFTVQGLGKETTQIRNIAEMLISKYELSRDLAKPMIDVVEDEVARRKKEVR